MAASALVAGPVDMSTPFSGTFLLEDGEALVQAIQSGDWVSGGLAAFSAIADTVAAVMDPLGSLIAAGLGWIMEHLEPLKGWLNDLTGDAGEVAGFAATWANIGSSLAASGDNLVRVLSDLDASEGDAIDAYRRFQQETAAHLHAAGGWAEAIGVGMNIAATIVKIVHDLTRDAIAQIVGSVISYAATLVITLGTATPLIIGQATSRVSSLSARIGTTVTRLLESAKQLTKLIDQLATLFKRFEGVASRALKGNHTPGEIRGLLGGEPRPVKLSDGSTHQVRTNPRPLDSVSSQPLLRELAHEHGLSLSELRDMIYRPDGGRVYDMSPEDARHLLEIRDGIPMPQNGETMQKLLSPTDAGKMLNGPYAADEVGGFVARYGDALRLERTDELYDGFGLDYTKNPFVQPDGSVGDVFAVRFEKTDAHPLNVPTSDLGNQAGIPGRYDPGTGTLGPNNPYLGNGFVGKGGDQIIPEYHLDGRHQIDPGSEMWRVRPDGSEELHAVLKGNVWVTVG